MRIPALIIALLFALFAVLQWNDPDPLVWILAYGAVALLWGLAATGRFYKMPTVAVAVVITVWMAMLVPGFVSWVDSGMPSIVGTMQAEAPHIEVVREFLGLLVALAAVVSLLRVGKRLG